jgi:Protein of unknown function (DUF1360)
VDPVTETPTEPVDYAAINAVWATLLGATLLTTRGEAPPARELPLYGLASFAMTKAISKEKVGTWMRDPLVDEGARRPKGSRLRYAAGELLTCTRCLGTWTSLGLVGLHAARPREAKIVATILATAGANDWLQSGFTWLCSKSNTAEKVAELHEEDRDARFSSLP